MNERVNESEEATRLARKAVLLGKDDPVALCMGGYALAFIALEFDDAAASDGFERLRQFPDGGR